MTMLSAISPQPQSLANAAVQTRDPRIDAAKGVAILLVVLGHAKGIPPAFTALAYSFHVPLFFLLSGWLSYRRVAHPLAQNLRTLMRTLLVPYATFFFLAYGYWLLTRNIGEKALRWGQAPWSEPLYGLLSGIGPALYVHPALWFLPALFMTALVHLLLSRRIPQAAIALLSLPLTLLWMGFFPPLGLRLPLALDVVPVALFFYACGALAGRTIRLPDSAWKASAAALLLAVPWLLLAWRNGRVDLNQLRFGDSPLVFVVASLMGTGMVLLASPLAARSAVLRWMGRNTLLILCVHILVFFALSGVASLSGFFAAGAKPGIAWALAVSMVSIVVCVPLRPLFAHYAPWALGLRTGAKASA